MRLATIFAVTTLLTACAPISNPSDPAQVSMNRPREAPSGVPVAATASVASFAPVVAPSRALRSNAEIAQDFIDLEFRMESGRPLPVFTRFGGPVTVAQ